MLTAELIEQIVRQVLAALGLSQDNKERRADGSVIDFGPAVESFDVNTNHKQLTVDQIGPFSQLITTPDQWKNNPKKYRKDGETTQQVLGRYRKAYGARLSPHQLAYAAAQDRCSGAGARGERLDFNEEYGKALDAVGLSDKQQQRYARAKADSKGTPRTTEIASTVARKVCERAMAAGKEVDYAAALKLARRELART